MLHVPACAPGNVLDSTNAGWFYLFHMELHFCEKETQNLEAYKLQHICLNLVSTISDQYFTANVKKCLLQYNFTSSVFVIHCSSALITCRCSSLLSQGG